MKLKQISIAGLSALFALPCFAGETLNGAGATFPAPIYQRWFNDYAQSTGNRVNYQSVGSGAGVRQFLAGTVDFAATDEPIKPSDAAKVKRGVVQIPMVGGTIAIAYNKPGCSLKLKQGQLASVFLGQVTDWKQLGCSAGPITVVHRSDSSGTTFAITNTLSSLSPEWKGKVGEGKAVKWPTGIGSKGNEGVAGSIRMTPGTIGYVNTAFAKSNKIQVAALENKSGKFVLPTASSGSAALNTIKLNENLAGEAVNPEGNGAYPISTLTWILAYREGNGAKTEKIKEALRYSLSNKAQMIADDLGYVPLSGSVLNRARLAVNRISK